MSAARHAGPALLRRTHRAYASDPWLGRSPRLRQCHVHQALQSFGPLWMPPRYRLNIKYQDRSRYILHKPEQRLPDRAQHVCRLVLLQNDELAPLLPSSSCRINARLRPSGDRKGSTGDRISPASHVTATAPGPSPAAAAARAARPGRRSRSSRPARESSLSGRSANAPATASAHRTGRSPSSRRAPGR